MKINHCENYTDLSDIVCDTLIKQVTDNKKSVICFATGSSPLLGYQKFVKSAITQKLDLSGITVVKLDEWCGLEMNDPATCEFFLQKEIIKPLGTKPSQYISFNSKAKDFDAECKKISQELQVRCSGKIDLTILGIGKNGHIGLNEPRDTINPYIHTTKLDEKTKTHSMLQQSENSVTNGITLGFKDILNSEKILFLITGNEKKEAYEGLLNSDVTTKNPSTFLKLHHNVVCVVDKNIM